LFGLGVFAGCKPKIGDSCDVSTDCSINGDRLCDTTQPGGYCTVFNCEPGTCPDEAICIAYGNVPSAAKECSDQQGGQRLQRTFCLRTCDSDSDCRSGYACEDMARDNPWRAIVVEGGHPSGKVCVVRFRGKPVESGAEAGVCQSTWPAPEAGLAEASVPDAASEAAVSEAGADADANASFPPPDASMSSDAEADATEQ
jgi:hypothetical protein